MIKVLFDLITKQKKQDLSTGPAFIFDHFKIITV